MRTPVAIGCSYSNQFVAEEKILRKAYNMALKYSRIKTQAEEVCRYQPLQVSNECNLISVDIPYRFAIQYLVHVVSKTDTPDHLLQK